QAVLSKLSQRTQWKTAFEERGRKPQPHFVEDVTQATLSRLLSEIPEGQRDRVRVVIVGSLDAASEAFVSRLHQEITGLKIEPADETLYRRANLPLLAAGLWDAGEGEVPLIQQIYDGA